MRSVMKLILANAICAAALLTLNVGPARAVGDSEYRGCCREQAAGPELYRYCCATSGPGACNCGGPGEEWCNDSEACNGPD